MLDWLRKAIRHGVETANACSAHDAGDWARAVTLLQPLAQERPDDAQVHYRLGDALYQLERAPVAGEGLLQPLEVLQRVAEFVLVRRDIARKLDGAFKGGKRILNPVELVEGVAQAVLHLGIVRAFLRERLQQRDGPRPVAGVVGGAGCGR